MDKDRNKLITNPDILLDECWSLIESGIESNKSNYHTMSLHYIAKDKPRSVNLIPRKLDKISHQINCHTDYRSQKVKHLQQNPKVCGLFWCRVQKTQIIVEATVDILYNTDVTKSIWEKMKHMSKICYCQDISPSTVTSEVTTGFTQEGWDTRNEVALTQQPYKNFSVLQLNINQLERLHLSANGHNKIKFTKNSKTKQWQHQWLSP